MRYQGSKKKIIKYLKPIIEANLTSRRMYVEPFMGGCNSLAYIDHQLKWGNDIEPNLVEMWKATRDGVFCPPMELTEEEYYNIKRDALQDGGRYSKALIGYTATSCSNGSASWNGYAHFNETRGEDHIREAATGFIKQVQNFKYLKDCKFTCSPYYEMDIPKNALIYCDPPYQDTRGYSCSFDHVRFWDWCRQMAMSGRIVLVSEYSAPEDFTCIWEMSVKDGLSSKYVDGRQNTKCEKLFVYYKQEKKLCLQY